MPQNFSQFTAGTPDSNVQYVVGYSAASSGGERRYPITIDSDNSSIVARDSGGSIYIKGCYINNTAGDTRLELGGAGNVYLDLKNPDSDDYDLRLFVNNQNKPTISTPSHHLYISPGGTGNVWIGNSTSTAPTHKLSVEGDINTVGNIIINNSNPTLFLRDTDNRSSMIHCQSNTFHILRGSGNNSVNWEQFNGAWPLTINLENNTTNIGGPIYERYENIWARVLARTGTSNTGLGTGIWNGYVTFSDGLIIQWGNNMFGGTYNFPLAFPSVAYAIVVSNSNGQGDDIDNAYGYLVSKSQYYINTKAAGRRYATGWQCSWIAIGE
jgi:hypothetical protein